MLVHQVGLTALSRTACLLFRFRERSISWSYVQMEGALLSGSSVDLAQCMQNPAPCMHGLPFIDTLNTCQLLFASNCCRKVAHRQSSVHWTSLWHWCRRSGMHSWCVCHTAGLTCVLCCACVLVAGDCVLSVLCPTVLYG
jgi:hypothetical protein